MANFSLNNSFYVPAFVSDKFVYNFTTVKKYGENYIKLITMNVQRTPNTEISNKDFLSYKRATDFTIFVDPWSGDKDKLWGVDTFVRYDKLINRRLQHEKGKNDKKLIESLIRSKRNVFEYAYSNDWDYFATFTIDKNKYDRFDLNKYHTAFSQFLRDYFRKKFGENVQYICIPEQHANGAWHEHALISGISEKHFELFNVNDNLPTYILDKLAKGEKIYNLPAYASRFGFCTFEPVRSSEACAKYITKYITKDMSKSVSAYGAKMYYASRGIKKAEIIKQGYYNGNYIADFVNDYCKQATFAYDDDFVNLVLDKFKD
ncbi:rolling circle replication-associated protein [Oscillospiraceae bacterium LCP25S3_E3]